MDNNLESLIHILKKPFAARTDSEKLIITSELSKLEFFNRLRRERGESYLAEFEKNVQLREYLAGEYIMREGDKADSFGVILRGRVLVLVPILVKKEDESEVKEEHPTSELGIGSAFGDISLITGTTRTASIKCLESTALLVILKKDYDLHLKQYQQLKHNEKINFLKQIEAFRTWTKKKISKISLFFTECLYKRHQVVYKEGDQLDNVYIIKSGEFKFYRRHAVKINNKLTQEGFLSIQANPKSYKRVFDAHKYNKVQRLEMAIKLKNEIFGYEEIVEGLDLRGFSCECVSSEGELWAISVAEFKKRINHHDSVNFFNSRFQLMKDWNAQRINLLETVEIFKVKSQFSINNIAVPAKKNNSHEKIDSKLTPVIAKSFSNQIVKQKTPIRRPNFAHRYKTPPPNGEAFNLFDTEIRETRTTARGFKTPSIEHTRNLIADLKPTRLNFYKNRSTGKIKQKRLGL